MIRLAIISALWALSMVASAAMVIDKAVITFPADGSPRQDVLVSNPDQEPLFIDVQVLDVHHPGTGVEEREVVKDPETIGLIATPRRLMVPPGGQRVVRLVNLHGHKDKEEVYRVNLTPVSGPVQSEQMGVRIMVGYQLLVFVQPREVEAELEGSREGRKLTLFNAGNVNILLHQGEQCPPSPVSEGECRKIDGKRLYPGNTVTVELPYDAPVSFAVLADDESRRRRFE